MSFTIGSLFDGSGGFPLAATMCGGTPLWASEVEPFPIAVTWSRFPGMKHLGSVTDINGGEVEPVDVVSFGSPCQDLSVAGKRAGLKHEDNGDDETTRSGLFMEAIRIIKEMRKATNGLYPRFAIWENVPGAFSSNKGEDFRTVLEELIKIVEPSAVMPPVPKNGWAYADCYCGEGWSLAYRVFDAQYWGVPQRRRRIYLVLDLRGECAEEILFKRDGLRGYFTEGRTPWQGIADETQDCVEANDREPNGERGCGGADRGVAFSLEPGIAAREGGHIYEGVSGTLRANAGDNQMSVAYSFDSLSSNSMKSRNPHSGCRQTEVAKTLDCFDPNPAKNQDGIAIVESVAFCQNKRDEVRDLGNVAGSLSAERGTHQQTFVAEKLILDDQGGQQINVRTDGKSPTLRAEMHGNVPCVMEAFGYDRYNQCSTGEVCATLRTPGGGDNYPVVCYGALASSAVNAEITDGKISQCLMARAGTGGNQLPLVAVTSQEIKPFCCIDGDKIGKAERAGGSGLGIREGDKMYTLTSKDAGSHAVAYGINGDVAATLDASYYKGCGMRQGVEREVVAYCIGNGQLNQITMAEQSNTLDCMHDQQAVVYHEEVSVRYIVRRLIPTECARLQGFADKWAHPIWIDENTKGEVPEFWREVYLTDCAIKAKKPKPRIADKQNGWETAIIRWYNGLHTDSSEYKLWGNGIALPNALYVMQGIADVLNQ